MSNDPYPNDRPDPHANDLYATDPYSAVTKNSTDPEGAAKLTKIGWITFATLAAVTLLAAVIAVIAYIVSEA